MSADIIIELPDGEEEHIWNEPRSWGIWVRYDPADPGGVGCEWGLGGTERLRHHDEHDFLVGVFMADRWSGAKDVFEGVREWAREALP